MAETLRVVSPVDNEIYAERPLGTDAEIDHTLEIARRALTTWGSFSLGERAAILTRAVDGFVAKRRIHRGGNQLANRASHSVCAVGGRWLRGTRPAYDRHRRPLPGRSGGRSQSRFHAIHSPCPARCGFCGRALELPLPHRCQCGGPSPHGRQCRDSQALGPDTALCRADGRGVYYRPVCRTACSNTCTSATTERPG